MRGFAPLLARARRRRHRGGSRGRERGASGMVGGARDDDARARARADRKLPAPRSAIQQRACRCSGRRRTFVDARDRSWKSASPTRPPQAARRSGPTCARVFSEIAPRYDLLNHLLSFNIDRRWRRRALARARLERGARRHVPRPLRGNARRRRGAGAAARVRGLHRRRRLRRADAARRGRARRRASVLAPVAADALQLPLARRLDARRDRGVRDPQRRVARPRAARGAPRAGAGRAVRDPRVLDAALGVVRALYHVYFHHVLPVIGGVISGHRTAYRISRARSRTFPPSRRSRDA